MTPYLGLINLSDWLAELRGTWTYIYQFTVKDTGESPREKIRRTRYVGKGREPPYVLGLPLSPNLRGFTILEALQNPLFWVFMEASLATGD